MNIELPGMVSIQFLSIPSGAPGPGKKIDPSPFAQRVGDIAADNILWSYEDPSKDAAAIKGYVAFYADQVDIRYPGEKSAQPAGESLSTYENPLLNWVLQEAPAIASSRELTAAFARQMRSAQIPL